MHISRSVKDMTLILMALMFHGAASLQGQTIQPSYTVQLSWDASSSSDVTGYRIHYGTSSGEYTTSVLVGKMTTGTVSGLLEGVTYYLAVSAFNAAGLHSPYSNEVIFKPGLLDSTILGNESGQPIVLLRGLIGREYDIEASEELQTWNIIDSVTIPEGGILEFTDPEAWRYPRRFYRIRQRP